MSQTLRQAVNGWVTPESVRKLARTQVAWSGIVSMAERTAQEEDLRALCEECLVAFETQDEVIEIEVVEGVVRGYLTCS